MSSSVDDAPLHCMSTDSINEDFHSMKKDLDSLLTSELSQASGSKFIRLLAFFLRISTKNMKRAIFGEILNIQRLVIVESQTIDQVNVEKKKWVNKSIFLWKVLWIRGSHHKIKNTPSTSNIEITMMMLDRESTLDQIRRWFRSLNYSGSHS